MSTNMVNIKSAPLSNIWISIHNKQHWDWVKKSVAYKESVYFNDKICLTKKHHLQKKSLSLQ